MPDQTLPFAIELPFGSDVELRLVRRRVKYARVQIDDHRSVTVVVPPRFGAADVQRLLNEKRTWMSRTLADLNRRAAAAVTPGDGELLLHGELYRLLPGPKVFGRQRLDHTHKTVHATLDAEDGEQMERWYRRHARAWLPQRLEELAAGHGFAYGRVSIRGQRTRWGSCSSRGDISLNWRLIRAPRFAADYVLLHELLHTRHLHHGPVYWKAMETLCPDYRRAIDWFARFGFLL